MGFEPPADHGPRSTRRMLHNEPNFRFHFVDGFFLPNDLLLQRLALRLDHFRGLEAQDQVVPTLPQEGIDFPGEDGLALLGEPLHRPVDERGFQCLAESLKAGLRGIGKNLRRAGKFLSELGAYEFDYFFKFMLVQQIGFCKQYANLGMFGCCGIAGFQDLAYRRTSARETGVTPAVPR